MGAQATFKDGIFALLHTTDSANSCAGWAHDSVGQANPPKDFFMWSTTTLCYIKICIQAFQDLSSPNHMH